MSGGASRRGASTRGELEAWLEGFLRDASFLEAYPYYAAILARMSPVADPSVARMAVSLHDGQFFLHLNVDSFLAEPQFLRGVLLHEVHHVVLGHLTHPKLAAPAEPELMELAVEMSANEYIEEPLPRPITCRAYSAVGIRPGQSTLERYEVLARSLRTTGKRPRATPGEEGAGALDDHRFFARGRTLPGATAQTAMLVERAVAETHEARDTEEGEAGPRRFLVAGRSPAHLVEELFETTRAPEEVLDWRAALLLFVARARSPVHTWSRPSRRFPSRIFEVPGEPGPRAARRTRGCSWRSTRRSHDEARARGDRAAARGARRPRARDDRSSATSRSRASTRSRDASRTSWVGAAPTFAPSSRPTSSARTTSTAWSTSPTGRGRSPGPRARPDLVDPDQAARLPLPVGREGMAAEPARRVTARAREEGSRVPRGGLAV